MKKTMRKGTHKLTSMLLLAILLLTVTTPISSGSNPPAPNYSRIESTLTLATTTSTQDSGLLDVLVPAFEKKYHTTVKVVAVGTGQAITLGKNGDADVVLVHSRSAEDEFVASGYGVNRKDVMHNEFLIVGPANDRANIKGTTNAGAAFKKIAASGAKFISRGDKSGTNTKELSIWNTAGITPSGNWYISAGQGMGETLTMADEMNAYTLTDEATYLAMKSKLSLVVAVRGDRVLFNPYGVIAVNPAKYPGIHYNTAMAFVNYLVSKEGQALIGQFGKTKFGKSLFVPDAVTVASNSTANKGKMVRVRVLNVRSGPGTTYHILGTLKQGASVTIAGERSGWYQITYRNRTAYVVKWAVK